MIRSCCAVSSACGSTRDTSLSCKFLFLVAKSDMSLISLWISGSQGQSNLGVFVRVRDGSIRSSTELRRREELKPRGASMHISSNVPAIFLVYYSSNLNDHILSGAELVHLKCFIYHILDKLLFYMIFLTSYIHDEDDEMQMQSSLGHLDIWHLSFNLS